MSVLVCLLLTLLLMGCAIQVGWPQHSRASLLQPSVADQSAAGAEHWCPSPSPVVVVCTPAASK